jgi:hypothetical protein
MKLRFLLDEHVNRAIQRQLHRLDVNIEVLAIGDAGAPPAGTSDPDILIWLEEKGYILVTENRSTIPGHINDHFDANRHFPGVFWIRPGTHIGTLVEELYLIWFASEAEEYQDCAMFIPL